MLTSLGLIFLFGLLFGGLFYKLRLPPLLGMILTGILLSPYMLNWIDPSILNISSQLRQIALVIILTRAGLSLDIEDLKKAGRPAILMCFVPAVFEITGSLLFAPHLFGLSILEAALMGSVLAAVSPAIVVPRMIGLMEKGLGQKHHLPQIILAGSSADDIFVLVLFTVFSGLLTDGNVSVFHLFEIPVSVLSGVLVGAGAGLIFTFLFKRIHIRDSAKVLLLLSISFFLVSAEQALKQIFPFSGLLAILSMGLILYKTYQPLARRLSSKYNKLWVGAEILLFVLVGATVDLHYAVASGLTAILFLFCVLSLRMLGVFVCLLGTPFSFKEKLFCMISYIPKATVQAAIGAVPLSMGLSCGPIILTVAVISILITAPLGAIGIDHFSEKLLAEKA